MCLSTYLCTPADSSAARCAQPSRPRSSQAPSSASASARPAASPSMLASWPHSASTRCATAGAGSVAGEQPALPCSGPAASSSARRSAASRSVTCRDTRVLLAGRQAGRQAASGDSAHQDFCWVGCATGSAQEGTRALSPACTAGVAADVCSAGGCATHPDQILCATHPDQTLCATHTPAALPPLSPPGCPTQHTHTYRPAARPGPGRPSLPAGPPAVTRLAASVTPVQLQPLLPRCRQRQRHCQKVRQPRARGCCRRACHERLSPPRQCWARPPLQPLLPPVFARGTHMGTAMWQCMTQLEQVVGMCTRVCAYGV